MITRVRPADEDAIREAGELIRAGEVVAFPTETVYGLGADAYNEAAVRRIFAAKGRPADNPLIVHVSDISEIGSLIDGEMPQSAALLAARCWPGPMTLIMKKSTRVPDVVSAGLDTVGIRLPENEIARRFIAAAGRPIAAPSANRSGRPSPTTAEHVRTDMEGRIPLILDGGASRVGLESTVIDTTCEPVSILRPGGVTPEMVMAVTGAVKVDGSVLRPLQPGEKVRSPGMKYRHYAPQGALTIVKGARANVARVICARYDADRQAGLHAAILALEENRALYGAREVYSLGKDAREMARLLFDELRKMDEVGATEIYSEAVDAAGIGLAVMNRLGRAAAFHEIDADC